MSSLPPTNTNKKELEKNVRIPPFELQFKILPIF
jgi:hypothetical protein